MADPKPLNAKQLRFVELYQKSVATGKPNGTVAYMKAYSGCSAKTAEANACRLLRDARIQQLLAPTQQAAQVAQTETIARIEINRERIRTELARMSFVNPKRLYHPDGTLKGIHELDDDTAAAIASVEVEETVKPGTETITRTKKIKFWDKRGSLKLLGDTEPGVWVNQEEKGSGRSINITILSDAELLRRIAELGGGGSGAGAPRAIEVTPSRVEPTDAPPAPEGRPDDPHAGSGANPGPVAGGVDYLPGQADRSPLHPPLGEDADGGLQDHGPLLD